MKIGYVATTVFPHYWVDTQQVVKNANALVESGCDVDLLIPRKWNKYFFKSKPSRTKYLGDFYGLDIKFNLVDIPHFPPSQIHVQKFFHALLIPLFHFFKKYDVIYTRAFWTLAVCSFFKIPCVLENHRIIKGNYKVYYYMYRYALNTKSLKGVVTNADIITRHYTSIGCVPSQVLTAHNAFDTENMKPSLSKSEARNQLGISLEKKIFCYAGNIRKYKGIPFLIKLASYLKEYDWLICGGYKKDILEARKVMQKYKADNVYFKGFIKVNELKKYLYAADYLIIPPTVKPMETYKKTIMPIKTYTYMAAGRPIYAPRMADIQEVLKHEENAILLPPDNITQAVADIRMYEGKGDLLNKIAKKALEDSKNYTWPKRGKKIHSFIRKVSQGALEGAH